MELKRANQQSTAKSHAQVEAESFLLASNMVALALKSHCCVVLANMDVNEATVTKLQLTFREERGLAILSFGLEMDKISHVLCELAPLNSAFPSLISVLHIALTFAVSSATCERSFSALKRIKTCRRSTMCETRLNDVAILAMERDLSKTLDLNDVIQKFAAMDKNRRIALYCID